MLGVRCGRGYKQRLALATIRASFVPPAFPLLMADPTVGHEFPALAPTPAAVTNHALHSLDTDTSNYTSPLENIGGTTLPDILSCLSEGCARDMNLASTTGWAAVESQ